MSLQAKTTAPPARAAPLTRTADIQAVGESESLAAGFEPPLFGRNAMKDNEDRQSWALRLRAEREGGKGRGERGERAGGGSRAQAATE